MSNVRATGKGQHAPSTPPEAAPEVPAGAGGTPPVPAPRYLSLHGSDRRGSSVGAAGLLEEARRFPALFEFLTTTMVDGRKREPSSLILFVEDGYPKVCLSDRDASRVTFVTSGGFLEALDDLEANLVEGTVDWRAKRPYKGK